MVRPNFDTLYSRSWLDLSREPVIVSMPATDGRYYILPFYDMWTNVFAAPGWRTSGTEAANWALLPPGWQGKLPAGVHGIPAPTPYVWIIGRIQTNGPADYANVNRLQDQMHITPLSQWGKPAQPAVASSDPAIDMHTEPLRQVNSMSAAEFFSRAAELLKVNPPQATDWSILERMRRIGLVVGQPFDLTKAEPQLRAALEQAPLTSLQLFKASLPSMGQVRNGWMVSTNSMGVYGNYYLKRAVVTLAGLGAIPVEDAIYPLNLADASGQPMTGEHRYQLHFAKEQLPPAEAFWSVTMYDGEGYQVANPLNRFAIGDRDALSYNADGSLDLYLQAQNPGAAKQANWLPAPASGALGVTMRLYAPRPEALDGSWIPPAVQRLD
ncbi:MAG: hypothetical protein A2Y50_12440 [Pseudomonadales bacterium RIFCSPLOWO2_12_59_9]|nr:MAG: hypothetical protein A2Y50_12440 [Pseudomonadales bacterium RIFCSPLOWO2_12_59_9]